MPRHDPFRGFRFRLEIDAIASAAFSEVVIGATTTDVVDYRDGNEPAHVRKLSGLTRFGNVILRRGMTTSLDLVQWHQQIVDRLAQRRPQAGRHRDRRRNGRRRRPLRRHQRLAREVRRDRAQRDFERGADRDAGAGQRRHRENDVSRTALHEPSLQGGGRGHRGEQRAGCDPSGSADRRRLPIDAEARMRTAHRHARPDACRATGTTGGTSAGARPPARIESSSWFCSTLKAPTHCAGNTRAPGRSPIGVSALDALESGVLAESLEIAVKTFDASFGPTRSSRSSASGERLAEPAGATAR